MALFELGPGDMCFFGAGKGRKVIGNSGAAIALAAALSLCGGPARADVFDTMGNIVSTIQTAFEDLWPDEIPPEAFSAKLGLGFGVTPDYTGSDEYRFRIIPLIDIRYNDLVALQGNVLRVFPVKQGHVRAGPLLAYQFGRKEKRNPVLRGMGDISDTVQLGGFLEYHDPSFVALGEVRKSLGAGQGTMAMLTVAHGLYRGESFLLGAAARFRWLSQTAMQSNFGVTADQSAATGLAEYFPEAGVSEVGFNLLGRYEISDRWRLEALAGYNLMLGNASDSPLVAVAGSRDQFLAGIGIRYIF